VRCRSCSATWHGLVASPTSTAASSRALPRRTPRLGLLPPTRNGESSAHLTAVSPTWWRLALHVAALTPRPAATRSVTACTTEPGGTSPDGGRTSSHLTWMEASRAHKAVKQRGDGAAALDDAVFASSPEFPPHTHTHPPVATQVQKIGGITDVWSSVGSASTHNDQVHRLAARRYVRGQGWTRSGGGDRPRLKTSSGCL
jgi:hypothetical protein